MQNSTMPILPFDQAVRERFSPRAFLSMPLTDEEISRVLQDAQHTPSNCNTQPWLVHIASGQMKAKLSTALLNADNEGAHPTPDFSFGYDDFYGDYYDRSQQQVKFYYSTLDVPRGDLQRRKEVYQRNFKFFNAPHVAFLFMPSFGDNVRVAADIGMYGQSFLLSLAARGFAGIPQTLLGMYARTVRDILGVSDEFKLMFGISFGHPDMDAPTYHFRIGRLPVEKSVVMHK